MTIFDYKQFHSFFTDFSDTSLYSFPQDASTIIIHWKAFYDIKGNPKIDNKRRPFRYKHTSNLPRIIPLSEKYQRDVYFLLDQNNSKKLQDQVFIVFPETMQNIATKKVSRHLYANHYSFQYNENNIKCPIQIHETLYTPLNEVEEYGNVDRFYGNIPKDTDLENLTKFFTRIPHTDLLVDSCSLPFQATGGKSKTKRLQNNIVVTDGQFENKIIHDYCKMHEIYQIFVFCKNNFVNIMFMTWKPVNFIGFSYSTDEAFTEANVRKQIIQYCSQDM